MSFEKRFEIGDIVFTKTSDKNFDISRVIGYAEDNSKINLQWLSNDQLFWIDNDPNVVFTTAGRRRAPVLPTTSSSASSLSTPSVTKSPIPLATQETKPTPSRLRRASRDNVISTISSDSDGDSQLLKPIKPTPTPKVTNKRTKRESSSSSNHVVDSDEDVDFIVDSDKDDDDSPPTKKRSSLTAKHHTINFSSVAKNSLTSLSRYVKELEPFVTSKVLYSLQEHRSFEEIETAPVTVQPRSLNSYCTLRDYQLQGVSWLSQQYDKCINSILADEMGLGKTIQTIAFLTHLVHKKHSEGLNLVIAPKSVLVNWMSEFKKFNPTLNVQRLYSYDPEEQKRLKAMIAKPSKDQPKVVITTYEALKSSGLASFIHSIHWNAVILDEGHRIKNCLTVVSASALNLKARFKLILTGTPVQNTINEVYSILHFLHPDIFTKSEFVNPSDAFDRELLTKIHYLMRIFLLRRLKSEVEVALPPKRETKIDCPLSEMQTFYTKQIFLCYKGAMTNKLLAAAAQSTATVVSTGASATSTAAAEVFEAPTQPTGEKEGTVIVDEQSRQHEGGDNPSDSTQKPTDPPQANVTTEANTQSALSAVPAAATQGLIVSPHGESSKKMSALFHQLRKASDHPYLFPDAELVSITGAPTQEIVTASGKMVVLDKLLKKLLNRGHRVVLFSQFTRMLDIICDYLDMIIQLPYYRLDGQTNYVMRQVLVNNFNAPTSKVNIFCLSTKAGGEGINLYTADTVILYDSDWNPQGDIQAIGRVHRIGQTKPVHTYRLISAGTIEERILQVAQKKLFLDSMINRGSTATSLALDQKLQSVESADSRHDSDVTSTLSDDKIFSLLKFGWNSVFAVKSGNSCDVDDEDLDRLIDREADNSPQASEANQQLSAEDYDESAPVLSVSDSADIIFKQDFNMEDISTAWRNRLDPTVAAESTTATTTATASVTASAAVSGKRVRTQRLKVIHIEDVGDVEVLDDEPSKTASSKAANSDINLFNRSRKSRQVAGRDYEHEDLCQICWDGGDLVCCDNCPAAYHNECLPKHERPVDGKTWYCPHHVCCKCNKRTKATGIMFRCEICHNAYCEDCLPMAVTMIGPCERFQKKGYHLPDAACYIHCSKDCHVFAETKAEKILNNETLSETEEDSGEWEEVPKEILTEKDESKMDVVETAGNPTTAGASAGVDAVRAIEETSCLDDVKARLSRHNSHDRARFINLSEIPNFSYRCNLLSDTVLSQLGRAISNLVSEHGGHVCTAGSAFDEAYDGDKWLTSAVTLDDAAYQQDKRKYLKELIQSFHGLPSSTPYSELASVFLSLVRLLSTIDTQILKQLADLIGLVSLTTRGGKDSKEVEPRFKRWTGSTSRRAVEEALAAFLLIPHPQNLLFLPANGNTLEFPVDSFFYTYRILEALGDCWSDTIKVEFVALKSSKYLPKLSFNPIYQGGSGTAPAPNSVYYRWTHPARRLYDTLEEYLKVQVPQKIVRTMEKAHELYLNPPANPTVAIRTSPTADTPVDGLVSADSDDLPPSPAHDDDDEWVPPEEEPVAPVSTTSSSIAPPTATGTSALITVDMTSSTPAATLTVTWKEKLVYSVRSQIINRVRNAMLSIVYQTANLTTSQSLQLSSLCKIIERSLLVAAVTEKEYSTISTLSNRIRDLPKSQDTCMKNLLKSFAYITLCIDEYNARNDTTVSKQEIDKSTWYKVFSLCTPEVQQTFYQSAAAAVKGDVKFLFGGVNDWKKDISNKARMERIQVLVNMATMLEKEKVIVVNNNDQLCQQLPTIEKAWLLACSSLSDYNDNYKLFTYLLDVMRKSYGNAAFNETAAKDITVKYVQWLKAGMTTGAQQPPQPTMASSSNSFISPLMNANGVQQQPLQQQQLSNTVNLQQPPMTSSAQAQQVMYSQAFAQVPVVYPVQTFNQAAVSHAFPPNQRIPTPTAFTQPSQPLPPVPSHMMSATQLQLQYSHTNVPVLHKQSIKPSVPTDNRPQQLSMELRMVLDDNIAASTANLEQRKIWRDIITQKWFEKYPYLVNNPDAATVMKNFLDFIRMSILTLLQEAKKKANGAATLNDKFQRELEQTDYIALLATLEDYSPSELPYPPQPWMTIELTVQQRVDTYYRIQLAINRLLSFISKYCKHRMSTDFKEEAVKKIELNYLRQCDGLGRYIDLMALVEFVNDWLQKSLGITLPAIASTCGVDKLSRVLSLLAHTRQIMTEKGILLPALTLKALYRDVLVMLEQSNPVFMYPDEQLIRQYLVVGDSSVETVPQPVLTTAAVVTSVQSTASVNLPAAPAPTIPVTPSPTPTISNDAIELTQSSATAVNTTVQPTASIVPPAASAPTAPIPTPTIGIDETENTQSSSATVVDTQVDTQLDYPVPDAEVISEKQSAVVESSTVRKVDSSFSKIVVRYPTSDRNIPPKVIEAPKALRLKPAATSFNAPKKSVDISTVTVSSVHAQEAPKISLKSIMTPKKAVDSNTAAPLPNVPETLKSAGTHSTVTKNSPMTKFVLKKDISPAKSSEQDKATAQHASTATGEVSTQPSKTITVSSAPPAVPSATVPATVPTAAGVEEKITKESTVPTPSKSQPQQSVATTATVRSQPTTIDLTDEMDANSEADPKSSEKVSRASKDVESKQLSQTAAVHTTASNSSSNPLLHPSPKNAKPTKTVSAKANSTWRSMIPTEQRSKIITEIRGFIRKYSKSPEKQIPNAIIQKVEVKLVMDASSVEEYSNLSTIVIRIYKIFLEIYPEFEMRDPSLPGSAQPVSSTPPRHVTSSQSSASSAKKRKMPLNESLEDSNSSKREKVSS